MAGEQLRINVVSNEPSPNDGTVDNMQRGMSVSYRTVRNARNAFTEYLAYYSDWISLKQKAMDSSTTVHQDKL